MAKEKTKHMGLVEGELVCPFCAAKIFRPAEDYGVNEEASTFWYKRQCRACNNYVVYERPIKH